MEYSKSFPTARVVYSGSIERINPNQGKQLVQVLVRFENQTYEGSVRLIIGYHVTNIE
jgi:hypothetical protein